ncbi:MAG: hypothetical protein HOW73_30445 [Polyangiaceae bacterium]|nr:hypothetical protein [Polyangiaceae bacterium]
MLAERIESPQTDLHDPTQRHLLFVRGPWEVRSPPGCCPLAPRWLGHGLWHLQFTTSIATTEPFRVSVLAFRERSVVGSFLVRASHWEHEAAFDARRLDSYLTGELGLGPASHAMRNLVHLMEDKALSSLLRRRAASIAAEPECDRARRESA